jgi:hypothetical protein
MSPKKHLGYTVFPIWNNCCEDKTGVVSFFRQFYRLMFVFAKFLAKTKRLRTRW